MNKNSDDPHTQMHVTSQVLRDNVAKAEETFEGEPETALIAAILWAFEVRGTLCWQHSPGNSTLFANLAF